MAMAKASNTLGCPAVSALWHNAPILAKNPEKPLRYCKALASVVRIDVAQDTFW